MEAFSVLRYNGSPFGVEKAWPFKIEAELEEIGANVVSLLHFKLGRFDETFHSFPTPLFHISSAPPHWLAIAHTEDFFKDLLF